MEITETAPIDKNKKIESTLPLGQKLLQAGFKLVTVSQMEERFSCKLITDRLKKEAREKLLEEGYISENDEDYKKPMLPKIYKYGNVIKGGIIFSFVATFLYSVYLSYTMGEPIFIAGLFGGALLHGMIAGIVGSTLLDTHSKELNHKICKVNTESLDTYMVEKIPERCLEHIKYAESLGVSRKSLNVAYPIITDQPVRKNDPIVYAVQGDNWVEITNWE